MSKVAIVTGGVGGIGQAICIELAKAGNKVYATYLPFEQETGEAFVKEQQGAGLDVNLIECDVTSLESCEAAAQRVESEAGSIDVLVNCAGITKDGTFKKMSKEQWDAVLTVNLDSVFNMTRPIINGMLERKYGRIVNIASVNGQKGQFGQCNYSASKAGMHGFTMALAQETAAKGITVNTVSPGYIGTSMVMAIPEDVRNQIIAQIPVGRLGKPEEIGRVVAFLAAEENGFTTGANIAINGGQWMH